MFEAGWVVLCECVGDADHHVFGWSVCATDSYSLSFLFDVLVTGLKLFGFHVCGCCVVFLLVLGSGDYKFRC